MENIQKKLYDVTFRKNLINDPAKYAQELGYDTDGMEIKVVINDKNTFYLAVNDNHEMIMDLESVQAAGVNTSTVSTAFSLCSTVSSYSTVGKVN